MKCHLTDPAKRFAQHELARSVTELVHGAKGLKKAEIASQILFGDHELEKIDSTGMITAFKGDPRLVEISSIDLPLTKLLASTNIIESSTAAKKLIRSGGLYINQTRVSDLNHIVSDKDFIDGRVMIVRRGKSSFSLVKRIY